MYTYTGGIAIFICNFTGVEEYIYANFFIDLFNVLYIGAGQCKVEGDLKRKMAVNHDVIASPAGNAVTSLEGISWENEWDSRHALQ